MFIAERKRGLSCVEFFDEADEISEFINSVCARRGEFSGVCVGVFEDGGHVEFQGWEDIVVDSVAHVHYIFWWAVDFFGGDFEDSRVWFSEIELVGVHSGWEILEDAELIEMFFQGVVGDKSI